MTPHKMIATGDEPGDCLRTAIACLLDIGPIAVPHFLADKDRPDDEIWEHLQRWLATQGLTAWFTAFPGEVSLEDVLKSVGNMNPNKYYIVGGRGYAADHVVIACNDEIVHDPAPMGIGISKAGSSGYWYIITLATDRIVKV